MPFKVFVMLVVSQMAAVVMAVIEKQTKCFWETVITLVLTFHYFLVGN